MMALADERWGMGYSTLASVMFVLMALRRYFPQEFADRHLHRWASKLASYSNIAECLLTGWIHCLSQPHTRGDPLKSSSLLIDRTAHCTQHKLASEQSLCTALHRLCFPFSFPVVLVIDLVGSLITCVDRP